MSKTGVNDVVLITIQEARKREQELENLSRQAEEKIQEATDESMLMSTSLQSAHDWFKTKFDDIHQQLLNSRYCTLLFAI